MRTISTAISPHTYIHTYIHTHTHPHTPFLSKHNRRSRLWSRSSNRTGPCASTISSGRKDYILFILCHPLFLLTALTWILFAQLIIGFLTLTLFILMPSLMSSCTFRLSEITGLQKKLKPFDCCFCEFHFAGQEFVAPEIDVRAGEIFKCMHSCMFNRHRL